MTDKEGTEISPRLTPYLMELKFQLLAAKTALDGLETNIEKRKNLAREFNRATHEDGVPALEVERRQFFERHLKPIANLTGPILGDVQGLLSAAGVIASILWPSARKFRDESDETVDARIRQGAEIRSLLSVNDESILNSRTGGGTDVRGGFLHFDEMIDHFLRNHPGEDFIGFDLGSDAAGTTVRRSEAVRWLDEDTLELYVNGRSANLREIWDEISRVVGRLETWSVVQLRRGPRRGDSPTAAGMAFGAVADPPGADGPAE